MATKLTRAAQKQIAALLAQAAGALPADADPALLEALAQAAADLGNPQPSDLPTGRTVSLKHAYHNLSARSFMLDARLLSIRLYYQGEPLWAISDDLQRIILHSGRVVSGVVPDTRLECR